MLAYQARAMRQGLALLGEPSTLDGLDCGGVNLQRSVEVYAGIGDTADDNPVIVYDVAAIDSAYDPRVGQVLIHPDGTFKLDRKVDDNGAVRRFIVVGA